MASAKHTPNRSPRFWRGRIQSTVVPSVMSGIMLMLLILANMCYLYGTTFRQETRVHALKVLLVDFDQGELGTAVVRASQGLQSHHFPTVELGSMSQYSDPTAIKQAVCKAEYWAALYVNKDASKTLASAVNGSSREYDPASAVTYTYNQARYPVIADSYIINGIVSVIAASRATYYESSSANATFSTLDTTDQDSVVAYLNPIGSSADLIQPTGQVSRVFHNTVNLVIPPLAQFFFLLALNGIAMGSGFHAQARVRDVWLFRFCLSKIYTCLSGITMAGYIWAFKETWGVTGSDFAKSWMLFWFLMDTQYQVMESIVGSFLPIAFTPFFVFTWIITNVASTVFPLEIMPGWYRVGYALPSHEAYSLMVQIWSGCADQTRVALPVMFSWWIIGHVTAVFSVRKRCSDARSMAANADAASEMTVSNAVLDVDISEDGEMTTQSNSPPSK
ncbi:hypothetical protein B0T10DRAFT_583346 [Thelonectria olida]|uniref:DUF3533 domain-containing protein n=1 Tax=Thelonectria olida TaxID=1576542 RepID=A0A9P9ARH1_9HYPO|nr:hypothetical protein B0T10DRAFT_583346 [Thelonectria olida]